MEWERELSENLGINFVLVGILPPAPWKAYTPVFFGKSQLITVYPNSVLIGSYFNFKNLGLEIKLNSHPICSKIIKEQKYIRCLCH